MKYVVPLPEDAMRLYANGRSCGHVLDGYVCTRTLNHSGPHIAHGTECAIMAWVDCDPDLLTDEGL